MRIGRKILNLLYGGVIFGMLLITLVTFLVVQPSVTEFEKQHVRSELSRVEAAFLQGLTTLHARTHDFSQQRDVIAYFSGQQQATPIPPGQSMDGPPLDLVLLLGRDAEVQFLAGQPSDEMRASIDMLRHVFTERLCYPFWGVTEFDNTPFLFSVAHAGDCNAVMFGQQIDGYLLQDIQAMTGLPLSIEPFEPFQLTEGEDDIMAVFNSDNIQAAFPVRDYLGQERYAINIELPRPLSQQGMVLFASLLIAALVVAIVVATFVQRRISRIFLSRLGYLHDAVRKISEQGQMHPVVVRGDDELAQIAQDFNTMLSSLQATQASLKQASENAESANNAKSMFLANMSHEIRTPMTAILGYTELLNNRFITEKERQRYLAIIQQNGDALMALISDVLDLSRIDAGQLRIENQAFNLASLLNDVIYSHNLRASQSNVKLELIYESKVPEQVMSDPFRLRQILVNLVGNALKFTDRGAVSMLVSWNPQEHFSLVIKVRDTGPGIPAEDQDAVFEPFSQLDDTHTRRHGGSGLGLPIARQLARSMAGDIALESEEGVGSTFIVALPSEAGEGSDLIEPEHPEMAQPKRIPQVPEKLSGTVLLVEDNRVNRMLVQHILENASLKVVEVENGQQALEYMRVEDNANSIDLIVMDLQMPVLDGYEAVKMLRDEAYEGGILALTANAMTEDRDRCLDMGFDEFLIKPVRAPDLLKVCEKLLRKMH